MTTAQAQACKRVLVVEDDVDIQEALAQILENEGYKVTSADNGLNAMSYLRTSERPCLILLDLMMPIMDGWQFRAEQRKDPKLAGIPIVVLSAHGSVPQHAAALEAAMYLKKPIDLDLLLDTVK
ncbi:MAG TPA: response regulator, partial [Planctomycetota bacterium]|nr:response regulator [Planctomycetota bacterium]